MGIVTDYLTDMIKKQVDNYKLVVWFDPKGDYKEFVEQLVIPETTIVRYEESFFALRHEIEPFIDDATEPPRLLIYVPLDEKKTQNALIEVTTMGVTMMPAHPSLPSNTRLSLIARNALKPVLGEKSALSIESQVQEGNLSLAELDKLAERGEGITKSVVSIVFGTSDAKEVALSFLNSDSYDKEIKRKGADTELTILLYEAFDIEIIEDEALEEFRLRIARYILSTDLIVHLQGEVPFSLSSVTVATKPAAREACITLARAWRLRRDLSGSYETYADRIEKELRLAKIAFKPEQIALVETFLAIEKMQQEHIAASLQELATEELVNFASQRQSSFWSEQLPEVQATWALTVVSGRVLLEANRIEKALRSPLTTVKTIFHAYTELDHPWCLMDTYHRHMERRYLEFSFPLNNALGKLLARAKNRYMEVGATLAEHFLRRYQSAKFQIDDVLRQTEIFEKKVKPKLSEGKVAYVWVDALRYEMAYELTQALTVNADSEMEAALGTIPTITPIGMAALLPGAQTGTKVVSAGAGKLALEVGGTVLKDRKDRVSFLKTHAGVSVFDAKLDDLLPQPNKKIQDGIKHADLLLITSQEIDMLGEENNVALARRTMDEVLRQLQQAFRVLGTLGVKTIIFTADHGYLFADDLTNDMKIDAPGGHTADLHRRAWVGQGGTADSSYLRTHISDFGLESELDIAVPWSFACFKVRGGAEAYFHGGMSPQELIIPVVTLSPKKSTSGAMSDIIWTLTLGSQKISTRLCSVQIAGKATGLFDFTPPKVRVEVRVGQKNIILPAGASYGFDEATGDVQLKLSETEHQTIEPCSVALLITETAQNATVSLHLIDSTSGVELARIDKIEMAIAM
jgi:PglZ domain